MSDYKPYANSRLQPWMAIGLVAAVIGGVIVLLCRLYAGVLSPLISRACLSAAEWQGVGSLVFWIQMLLFASMWITYFMSKAGPKWLQVPSLRRLLLTFSEQWQAGSSQSGLIDEYRKKGTTGISAMAMLAAAAGLALAQANLIVATRKPEAGPLAGEEAVIVLLSVVAAFVALLCFIIASDALDSMFNKIVDTGDEHRLVHHFYFHSVYTRYIGFMMLLCAAILLIAYHDRLVGAAASGLVYAIGYAYWFPRRNLLPASGAVAAQPPSCFMSLPWGLMLRLAVGAGVPLLLFLVQKLHPCA